MIVHLKDGLDAYHQRRADEHGHFFKVVRVMNPNGKLYPPMYEARSVATGVVCTLDQRFLEELPNAVQEP